MNTQQPLQNNHCKDTFRSLENINDTISIYFWDVLLL